jgi:guanylate kinase
MAKILISLTGPSGVGKGYLKNHLKNIFGLAEPPVYTTRKKRKNENCSDRIFLGREDFQERMKKGDFILANEIYGNFYGFHKGAFLNDLAQITEIYSDNVKKFRIANPSSLMIGILPKSLDFLVSRLRKREANSREAIFDRLNGAQGEIDGVSRAKGFFDYSYFVGADNEGSICGDMENYIRNHYKI